MSSRPSGGDSRGVPAREFALGLALLCLVVSGLPLGASAPSTASSAPALSPPAHVPPTTLSESLTVENSSTGNLSSFWGVGVDAGTPLASAASEVQGTPITWYEYPAGKLADSFNMTNGQIWINGYPEWEGSNESMFVHWCESISCHAILAVPGEINDSANAAYEVWFTEQVLHFHPAYWQVGNEPAGWEHLNIPWKSWLVNDSSSASPGQYAAVVHSYVGAMLAVDPTLQILGLPGVGAGSASDVPWINATVRLNGPNITGVAIHDYPAESGPSNATVAKFLAQLTNTASSVALRVVKDRDALQNLSPTHPLKLFVDEFGSGTGTLGTWQPYMQTYPQVPFVAGELISMMETGVFNAELYDLRSAYNGSLFNLTGVPRAVDSLYTQLLPHFDPTLVQTVVSHPQTSLLEQASESNASNSVTLLAVNTNTVDDVQLTVNGSIFPSEGSYSTWSAENSSSSPDGTFSEATGFGATSNWTLLPEEVLLVSVCRPTPLSGGTLFPVTFCESGLPHGTTWSVTLGGVTTYSTSGTITFPEPNGAYSYSIGSVPGWRTGNTSGSLTVHGAAASVQVPWTVVKFPVTFAETGLPSGTPWSVTINGTYDPNGTLYRSTSGTISLSLPNGTFNYSLGEVPGWTTPHFTGTFAVLVTPVAFTVNWTRVTYLLSFGETGLPSGTNWSVDLAGSPVNSTGPTISFNVPNGTYDFSVGKISNYTPDASSGQALVADGPLGVSISWNRTPFEIEFNETGLPAGQSWGVNLTGPSSGNATPQGGAVPQFAFYEPNGTYTYAIGKIAGWRATSGYAGSVTVAGTTAFVTVRWAQVTYNLSFFETNLPQPGGASGVDLWSIDLNGTVHNSTSHLLTAFVPNGTYPWKADKFAGYLPSIPSGLVTINGSSVAVTINWTRTLYLMTFDETGLHTGNAWTINITGSNITGRVTYHVYGTVALITLGNGTFHWVAATGGTNYRPSNPVGTFLVDGAKENFTIKFGLTSLVDYTETGLPTGTLWSVNVDQQNGSYTTNTTVPVYEPFGNNSYTFGLVPGWTPTPDQGFVNITATGTVVTVPIHWAETSYSISFVESGLPAGQPWSVVTNGTSQNSTTDTITFPEANGTYAYGVGPLSGWTLPSYGGLVAIDGANVTVNLTWTEVLYSVTFVETGLPASTNWSVNLNGSLANSTTRHIGFLEPNGTSPYQFGVVPGYRPLDRNGTVVVNGLNVTVDVTFGVTLYTVTFSETGLPGTSNWSVGIKLVGASSWTVNWSSTGGPIEFQEPNGSYSYQYHPPPDWTTVDYAGDLTVSGATASRSVVWVPMTFTVTFLQFDFTGVNWSVTLDGMTEWNVSGGSIVFTESNGTFAYEVGSVVGWSTAERFGNVTTAGADASYTVAFQKDYLVTFEETGLPNGTEWSVTFDELSEKSNTSTILFEVTNGTHPYTIAKVLGYEVGNRTGSVDVDGTGAGVDVSFTPYDYLVTFSETGLAAGTEWSIALNGVPENSTTSTIEFTEIDGTYPFIVGPVVNYHTTSTVRVVTVTGANVTVIVPFAVNEFPVTFTESGLPIGTLWTVTVDGMLASSRSANLTLLEPNGSYTYRVGTVSGWTPAPGTGSFSVTGGSASVSLSWTIVVYTVTFTESGLPAGTLWNVSLSGTGRAGTTASLSFTITNGTYSYTVNHVSGFDASPTSGPLTVNGSSVAVTIAFTAVTAPPPPTKGPNSSNTVLGVPPLETALILAAIIIAAVVAWAVLTRQGRRAPEPNDTPPPPSPPPPT
jgi:hypothetical protein